MCHRGGMWESGKRRSNAKQIWAKGQPMNCEELLVVQAQMTAAASPGTTVWAYRNSIKALPVSDVEGCAGEPCTDTVSPRLPSRPATSRTVVHDGAGEGETRDRGDVASPGTGAALHACTHGLVAWSHGRGRAQVTDPAYASWFIPFANGTSGKYHVPVCDNNYNPPLCSGEDWWAAGHTAASTRRRYCCRCCC